MAFKGKLQTQVGDYAKRKDELTGEWDMATRQAQNRNERLALTALFLMAGTILAGTSSAVLAKRYSLLPLSFTVCALIATATGGFVKYKKIHKSYTTTSALAGERLSAVEQKHDYARRKLHLFTQATDGITRTMLIHSEKVPQAPISAGTRPTLAWSKDTPQP